MNKKLLTLLVEVSESARGHDSNAYVQEYGLL